MYKHVTNINDIMHFKYLAKHFLHKIMLKKIKLIWDFRGPSAQQTAKHHEIHLQDYIKIEKLELNITKVEFNSEFSATAYMVVTEKELPKVKAALKPHKGQYYEN